MLKHWREMKAQHPADDPVLPGRRLLRDVPRGRRARGAGPRHHADLARRRRAAGRRAGEGRRRIPAPARRARATASPSASRWRIPKLARGLVRREVVETVTPGALLQEGWLAGGGTTSWSRWRGAERRGSGLAGDRPQHRRVPARDPGRGGGLAEALGRLGPAEVVVAGRTAALAGERRRRSAPCASAGSSIPTSRATSWPGGSRSPSLDGLGVGPDDAPALGAAGALLRYLTRAPARRAAAPARGPHRAPERRVPLARRDDPAQPRAGRAAPRRRPRLHPARDARRHRDADGRPPAPAVAALAAARSGRDRATGWTRSRWRCATAAAAPGCARRSTACGTWSGWPAAPPRAAPRRASSARSATRSSGCPTSPRR